MIKTIKHIISVCAVTSLLALSFIGCTQPTIPEVKYKVTFDENGHGTKTKAIEVTENTILSTEQLKSLTTNEEFTFVGWFDESDKQAIGGEYKVTKNVTLKAKWTDKTYTVNFDVNGHGKAPDAISNLKKGNKVTEPDALTTEADFTFGGWYKETECITQWDFSKNTVSSDITLYAKWTPWDKVADVTFSQIGAVDYQDQIILSCDTPNATIHYTINKESEQTFTSSITLTMKEACTISAYATKEGMTKSNTKTINFTIKTYTVTFDANGHGETIAKSDLKKGDVVSKPKDLSADGLIFVGWFNGDNKITSDIVIEKSDITLTARWRTIGDIILNDGTYVSVTNLQEAQKTKAVAIVCGKNSHGNILGLGLKQNEKGLKWALQDKTSNPEKRVLVWGNRIPNIRASIETGTNGDDVTFSGDLDGSDNWDEIVNFYITNSQTEKDALDDCPAFYWVNNYGETYKLPTEYKDGWYIPSIAELTDIYRNRKVIDKSLELLGEDVANRIKSNYWYWSSSQADMDYTAWNMSLDLVNGGSLGGNDKSYDSNVCCVRVF